MKEGTISCGDILGNRVLLVRDNILDVHVHPSLPYIVVVKQKVGKVIVDHHLMPPAGVTNAYVQQIKDWVAMEVTQ